ncbi:STAS domain-containing protein [Heyndrickxia coagulans]|uniref:STAS domain-containing protein n=1 Tax=Heyndrickxia coagulans TaxID=1398 RepID=UPI001A9480D5
MSEHPNIQVGGLQFEWELDKGRFIFEGEDAVLFWIPTAMRDLFTTIEEISGEEASNVVFETAGFRQGLLVADYFNKIKDFDVKKASELITTTYASAGWGRAVMKDMDFDQKTLTIELKDSWEHKINAAQGKKTGSNFLPAHYAGIFTGLLHTNIWYKVVRYQIEGHDSTIIEYFPSDITVSHNIHQLARKKEAEQIIQLEALVEDKTRELKELVKQLSSPIIPILDGIVVVPLIGKYDDERAEELIEKTLKNLPQYKAKYLVLDLTALDVEDDPHSIQFIENIGKASSLIGTQTILVGISPSMSMTISSSGLDFSQFDCFQTLQHSIHYALGQLGRKIL